MVRLTFFGSQVPPDFYIPEFDEDEQNPDERIDRKEKEKNINCTFDLYILVWVILASPILITQPSYFSNYKF